MIRPNKKPVPDPIPVPKRSTGEIYLAKERPQIEKDLSLI